jgi:hypothetical protein
MDQRISDSVIVVIKRGADENMATYLRRKLSERDQKSRQRTEHTNMQSMTLETIDPEIRRLKPEQEEIT